ncbi:MAG: type III restriction endonuclease subunit R, partial [Pseudomonadota bacterium]
TKVVTAIDEMTLVSLTATPPYDASSAEWQRYAELCGEIDEEISVPELVKAGTLCPHQDFVWTVVPAESERQIVREHAQRVNAAIDALQADQTLLSAVQDHAWLRPQSATEEAVFSRPELAFTLLTYIQAQGLELPRHLLSMLGLSVADLPQMDNRVWQQLLDAYLYQPLGWSEDERYIEHRKNLNQWLRQQQLLNKRELQLAEGRLMKRHMTQSMAKVHACVDIYHTERKTRGTSLRQVILTDYIRYAPGTAAETSLGAWPVFKALATRIPPAEQRECGLLTGRMIILHSSLVAAADLQQVSTPLPELEDFCQLKLTTSEAVTRLTQLLMQGRLKVLVGTRALLGEGWDAPCINSLILASSVGSYMLTNQMRGRAIRIDREQPNKVASIWHVVAIVLDRHLLSVFRDSPIFWPGLADFSELDKRFSTFVGLHQQEPRIENNLLRLQLPYIERVTDPTTGRSDLLAFKHSHFINASRLEKSNQTMIQRLQQGQQLQSRWQHAIGNTSHGQIVPTVSQHQPPTARMFHMRTTMAYVTGSTFCLLLTVLSYLNLNLRFFSVLFLGVFIWSLPKMIRAAILYYRHLPVDGTVHQIGIAVRDTLCATGAIEGTPKRLRVHTESHHRTVLAHLSSGTFHDKSIFVECLEEVLGPVDNPRYLLIRQAKRFGRQRHDYHAVPARFGARKADAELFLKAWQKHVGEAELIYTRTTENRKLLMHARSRAFANAAERFIERRDRWYLP